MPRPRARRGLRAAAAQAGRSSPSGRALRRRARRCIDRRQPPGDEAANRRARAARAIVLYRQGKIDECATWAERAAEGATALDDRATLGGRLLHPRRGGGRPRRAGARVPRPRASRSSRSSACCSGRRPCSTTWAFARTTRAPGTRRSSSTTAPRKPSGERATCSPAGMRRTTGAEILLDQGRLAEAAELFDVALRTYRAAKFPVGEALVMINLGRLAAEEGRFADAHRYLDDARAQLEALGAESFLIEADARRAQAFILEGAARRRGRAGDRTALERMRSAGELGVRSALLERLLGLAAVQARTPRRPRRISRRACGSRGRSAPSTSSGAPCTRRSVRASPRTRNRVRPRRSSSGSASSRCRPCRCPRGLMRIRALDGGSDAAHLARVELERRDLYAPCPTRTTCLV